MTFRLPDALVQPDDRAALSALDRYYGPSPGSPGFFTGSLFDTWDSAGRREQDADRFTADDLVAVTFLSVDVDPVAANQLLVERSAEFAGLLAEVGPDRDLVDLEETPEDWAGWRLYRQLMSLPGTGPTTASKLLARKRPRLRPIYDTVVAEVTGTWDRQWEPLREALRANNRALHDQLLRLRDDAGLPPQVSALRVLDVIAWMEGRTARA